MKLQGLKLENYRGFGDVIVELDGASALLVWKNGAGKTTILDAIATALSPVYKEVLQDDKLVRALNELDVR